MSIFNSIRVRSPKRNKFNLSHNVLTTCDAGTIIPIMCEPVYPGDSANLSTEILVRMPPFRAPIMQNLEVCTRFFFVPYRLLWNKWKEFITQGEDGKTDIPFPRLSFDESNIHNDDELLRCWNYIGTGSLADYLNLQQTQITRYNSDNIRDAPSPEQYTLNSLPFKAYQLIWNEYFRDQNIDDEVDIHKSDVGDVVAMATGSNPGREHLLMLRQKAWTKDYFTSALPWPQRGDDVMLPLTGDAPIKSDGSLDLPISPINGFSNAPTSGSGNLSVGSDGQIASPRGNGILGTLTGAGVKNPTVSLANLYADMGDVTSATINELRRAIKAQEFLETRARGGSRYIEQIMSFFGVRSSDARLQRPEYLGGGKSPIIISDVLQTSQTTETSPQASPSGHGVGVQKTHQFKAFFEEHGLVIGVMYIMPKAMYMQGISRKYTKFNALDYYWPQFAHLGEQEIRSEEIYNDAHDVSNHDDVFGYAPRYSEYKYIPDSVHGDFRDSLNFWHMGRIFANQPQLTSEFLHNVDSVNRPFSVQDSEYNKFWCMVHHNLVMRRPMPKYGTPFM